MNLILLLSLFVSSSSLAPTNLAPTNLAPTKKKECDIKKGEVLKKDKNICVSVLDFKTLSPPWLKKHPLIKKKVDQIIKSHRTPALKSAQSIFKEYPSTALLPYRVHVEELNLFKHNKKNIVSVRLKVYVYTGGAHGNSSYYSWNFNPKKKKFLSLNEVLTPSQFENLKKKSRVFLIKKFETKKRKLSEGLKEWIRSGTSTKKDFEIWNFNKNGITIVFKEYQVSSYAYGSHEIFFSDF